MTREQFEAYCRTRYVALLAGREWTFRLGESHPDIAAELAALRISSWAIVTAWNPASRRCSAEENERAHTRLVDELETLGLTWSPGDGHPASSDWPIERGCFVHNVSSTVALELCRQFGQTAVVFGETGRPTRLLFGDLEAHRGLLESLAATHPEETVRRLVESVLNSPNPLDENESSR